MASLKKEEPLARRGISGGLYQKLSNKLDTSFDIKQKVTFSQIPKGEFLHITSQSQNIFLFMLATGSDGHRRSLNPEDVKALLLFQQRLLPSALLQHTRLLVPFIILATDNKNQAGLRQRGFHFTKKSKVSDVVDLIHKGLVAKASAAVQLRLKSIFNPETYIPTRLSQSNIPFLDETQESILKYPLQPLSKSSKTHSNNILFQGTTGSGKTLILAKQAKLLRELYPERKVLLLTADRASENHLKQVYQAINPDDENIELLRFRHWCRAQAKGVLHFIYDDEALDIATDVINRSLKDYQIEPAQIIEEVNYVADRNISTVANYLAAERLHMSLTLDEEMQNQVWKAIQDFAFELRLRRSIMPSSLPVLLWNQVLDGKTTLPLYDFILIDGAQSFAPLWLQLLHKALHSSGRMIMMADLEQGPLNRAYAWREANIETIEHDGYLDTNYRTPVKVTRVAQKIAKLSKTNKQPPSIVSAKKPVKATPLLLHLDKNVNEIQVLAKEIKALIRKGVDASKILILIAGNTSTRRTAMNLRSLLGTNISLLSDPQQSESSINIASLDDVSEIESPIVFIVGLQHLFKKSTKSKKSSRYTKYMSDNDIRNFYTGMMRTTNQLILTFSGNRIPDILQQKELKIISYPVKKSNVHYIPAKTTAKKD